MLRSRKPEDCIHETARVFMAGVILTLFVSAQAASGAPEMATGEGFADLSSAASPPPSLDDCASLALSRTLNNPSSVAEDQFGRSVAVSESYLLVSATEGADGRVYLFNRTTGELLRTFESPSPTPERSFGEAIAVSEQFVLIGEHDNWQTELIRGRAHLFNAASGALIKSIDNPELCDHFGVSVAISGSYALVGVAADRFMPENPLCGFLFDAASGNLLRSFRIPSDQSSLASLGWGVAVAISGDRALFGALWVDSGTTISDCGGAFLYDAVTGDLVRSLDNPTPAGSEWFGISVALSGDKALIGAPYDNEGDVTVGAVYLVDALSGDVLQRIVNPRPSSSPTSFGTSVGLSGDLLLVGSPYDQAGADFSGAAFLYRAETGELLQDIWNPTPAASDGFGAAVALAGGHALVSAPSDNTAAARAGSAYLYACPLGSPSPSPTPTMSPTPLSCETLVVNHALRENWPAAEDRFGYSVAISGTDVLVGAPEKDNGAVDAGAAYLFNADTGELVLSLLNPSPGAYDYFGQTLAVLDDILLIGAPKDNITYQDLGTVYQFDKSGTLVRTFDNPSPFNFEFFGSSISVSDEYILIGSWADSASGKGPASAYLYDTKTGSLVRTFENPSSLGNSLFGAVVSVSNDYALFGSSRDNDGAITTGAAFLYRVSTGELMRKIRNPFPALDDRFGYSVAISGTRLLVGAPYDNSGQVNSGSAYLFDSASGLLVHSFGDPAPTTDGQFGGSIGISGDRIVIGYLNLGTVDPMEGSAFVFDAVSGALLQTITNPVPADSSDFGQGVAISGEKVAVGAWLANGSATRGGAAYVFGCPLTPSPTPTPGPPTFQIHPVAQSANPGQTIGLTASATGQDPITYQWLKDGTPLDGETGTALNLGPVSTADAGLYRCDATNPGGTTHSNDATLAVFDPPAANGAAYASTTLPAQIYAGESLYVGITIRNTSALTWSAAQGYSLAVTADPGGLFQGVSRLGVPDGSPVVPASGGLAQFIALVHAPATPGPYQAGLRMVEEGVEFFGETATLSVVVVPRPNAVLDWSAYE